MTTATLGNQKIGASISLYVSHIVRENIMDLYGFPDSESRNLFELLLGVSGIGPKSALATLNVAPVLTLQKAIGANDTKYLTNVSGIGKKTAERIVIELHDKLSSYAKDGDLTLSEEGDVMEALKALGYREQEIRDALQKLPETILGTNEKIKTLLKTMGS